MSTQSGVRRWFAGSNAVAEPTETRCGSRQFSTSGDAQPDDACSWHGPDEARLGRDRHPAIAADSIAYTRGVAIATARRESTEVPAPTGTRARHGASVIAPPRISGRASKHTAASDRDPDFLNPDVSAGSPPDPSGRDIPATSDVNGSVVPPNNVKVPENLETTNDSGRRLGRSGRTMWSSRVVTMTARSSVDAFAQVRTICSVATALKQGHA